MTSHPPEKLIPEDEEHAVSDGSDHTSSKVPIPKTEENAVDTPDEEFEVTLGPDDPKQWSLAKKWFIVMLVCSGALCGTCASSMVRVYDSALRSL